MFADVTSANVVGYVNDPLTQGAWKSVCSQFFKIGSTDGSDMKLGDLKPNLDGNTTHWAKTDKIKIINTGCAVDFQAKYYRWSDLTTSQKNNLFGGDEANFTEGWYKCENTTAAAITAECVNNHPIPFGSCILASSAKTAATFASSGEVYEHETGLITLTLTQGAWRYIGNCTPVNLTLGDFKPNLDGNTTHWAKTDKIKIINTGCAVDFQAKYYRWSDLTTTQKNNLFGGDEANFTEGWYKCENTTAAAITAECVNSYPINAGSGFLASSAKTAAAFTLPTAL